MQRPNEEMTVRDMQAELGGYREAWDDLGKVLQDFGGLGMVPAPDAGAHMYSPLVLERLGHIVHHPHLGRHAQSPHFRAIHNMLQHLYGLMHRNVQLQREKALWHEKANVVESVQWTAVGAATLSSTATIRAPYSGVNYMILDMLMPAELTPLGWFTQMTFAGINFAQPSLSSVTYGPPGASGTPAQQGMGFSVFYTNKTCPEGSRGWSPWTGWILSSDAVILLQWFNPDALLARSLDVDFLMRSSPCGALFQQAIPHAWHVSQGYHHVVDQIYGAVLGLSGGPMGVPTAQPLGSLLHGQHLHGPMGTFLTTGQGHIPSGGVPAIPGHAGPTGVPYYG